jgi:hypothetical protein
MPWKERSVVEEGTFIGRAYSECFMVHRLQGRVHVGG